MIASVAANADFREFSALLQFRARNVAELCYDGDHIGETFCQSGAAVTLSLSDAANFSAPPEGPQPQAVLKALVDWTRALNDISLLPEVLEQALTLIRAEAVALTRHDNRSNTAVNAAVSDRSDRKHHLPRLTRSCAADLLGRHTAMARPGTLWLMSQLDRPPVAGHWLAEWRRDRQMVEIAVLVLASDQRHSDFLELHFRNPLTGVALETLNSLAQALAYAWTQRNEAYVMQLVLNAKNRNAPPRQEPARPILDSSNPLHLSRAEFRICMLAGRGMHAKEIAQELSLQESTVRCHLRNIYKKTGATGQMDLMYRLHGAPAVPGSARLAAEGAFG